MISTLNCSSVGFPQLKMRKKNLFQKEELFMGKGLGRFWMDDVDISGNNSRKSKKIATGGGIST